MEGRNEERNREGGKERRRKRKASEGQINRGVKGLSAVPVVRCEQR